MNNAVSIWSVPRIKLSSLLLFMLISVAAGTGLPWLVHALGGAALGQALLPVFFVALLTGALFGWEMGLASGLAIPLASHAVSGMPVPAVLGPMLLEASLAGFFPGLFHHKFRMKLLPSVLVTLLLTRLLSGALFALGRGDIALMPESLVRTWPGLVLQVLLLPPLASWLEKKILDRPPLD